MILSIMCRTPDATEQLSVPAAGHAAYHNDTALAIENMSCSQTDVAAEKKMSRKGHCGAENMQQKKSK